MKLIGNRVEGNHVFLSMETDPKIFSDFYHSEIYSVGQKIRIDGFRKGKAPLTMVVKYLQSRGHWRSEVQKVLEKVVEKTWKVVLEENKDWDQKVYGSPVGWDILNLTLEDWHFTFEAKFECFPKTTVGDYSTIPTLVESRDLDCGFWPVLKEGAVGEKDVVSIVMEGRDSENNPVIKYCYDLLEIDMENTKLKKELVNALIGMKTSERKELTIKDGGEDINLKMVVIMVREKREVDINIAPLLGLVGDNVDLEKIKACVRHQYEIYNFVLKQRDLLKWMLSDANRIDPVPVENLKRESLIAIQKIKKTGNNPPSLKHVFHEQINSLKSSLVVTEISKMENMEVTEEDHLNLEKDMGDNPWKYGELTLEIFRKMDGESIKHSLLQFKVLELLSNNWKFSN